MNPEMEAAYKGPASDEVPRAERRNRPILLIQKESPTNTFANENLVVSKGVSQGKQTAHNGRLRAQH